MFKSTLIIACAACALALLTSQAQAMSCTQAEMTKMDTEMSKMTDTTKKEDSLEDLVDIYARGDLDAIYSFYKKEDLSNTFNAALITDRNHRMADRIDSIMQKISLFTAVGALHLPGDEGVINLLRKKGYVLTPVWKKD